MLQDNVEGYRKEIATLNEKTQKQTATIQQNQQTIHTLTQDLRVASEKRALAEVCLERQWIDVFVSVHCSKI